MQGNANRELTESEILQDYIPKLVRLADRNISQKLRQREDADDLQQSVLRTVWRQAQEGKLSIEQSEDFWRLLVAITLNKARKKARFHSAKKRDISREQVIAPESPQLAELAVDYRELNADPSQEQGDSLAEVLQKMDGLLDEKCQQVLVGKLSGQKHEEIAQAMAVSTKSVSRYLKKIEILMREFVLEQDSE